MFYINKQKRQPNTLLSMFCRISLYVTDETLCYEKFRKIERNGRKFSHGQKSYALTSPALFSNSADLFPLLRSQPLCTLCRQYHTAKPCHLKGFPDRIYFLIGCYPPEIEPQDHCVPLSSKRLD